MATFIRKRLQLIEIDDGTPFHFRQSSAGAVDSFLEEREGCQRVDLPDAAAGAQSG